MASFHYSFLEFLGSCKASVNSVNPLPERRQSELLWLCGTRKAEARGEYTEHFALLTHTVLPAQTFEAGNNAKKESYS